MKKKLLVIEVAGLGHHFGIEGLESRTMQSVFPALTCTVQASFRTASLPDQHGMVSNGLFFRRLNRPSFWEQSSNLVHGQRIWDEFRKRGKRVAMLFWQQSLGENVDIILSPGPVHKHHGGMIQDCYSQPADLYQRLCRHIGCPFKLHQYWGPMASWKVGEWIVKAASAVLEDPELAPDLCLTYLPTMDYDLQRNNPHSSPGISGLRAVLEKQIADLARLAINASYDVLVFGDYHIAPVHGAVMPNLELRNAGFMNVRDVKGMLYPDFHSTRAFAMVDHEIAHVYINDREDIQPVQDFLSAMPGVADVLDADAKEKTGLKHKNSGELIIIAEEGKWLAYPWWKEKKHAPDFAGHVDIHNKPGYDPCELFFGWPPGSVSQDTSRIKGSHGRIGNGREVTFASSFLEDERPSDLIELAESVRRWLNEDI